MIVQARMGSTRLPGKVMRDISGRPMIDRVVERARRIPAVDGVAVATSSEPVEEPLVAHLRKSGVPVHRGPEADVLSRFVGAVDRFEVHTIVRITADCPLLMPEVSGRVLDRYREGGCDYASNTLERTYPRGLDTEVLGRQSLERAADEATEPGDREHVTPYLRRHPELFELCSVTSETDRSELRWTVDEEADLELVRRVYELLPDPMAGYGNVLKIFEDRPELKEINRQVRQRGP